MTVLELPPVRNGLVAYWPMAEFVGHNTVVNGDFEDYPATPGNPAGWNRRHGTELVERVEGHSGSGNAVKITAAGGGFTAQGLQQTLPAFTAGQRYRVTCRAATGGGSARARIAVTNLGDSTTAAETQGTIGATEYEHLSITFVAAGGASYSLRPLHRASPPDGEVVFFRDIEVRQVGPVLDIAGGHHATNVGSTLKGHGHYGMYRSFDGVDDYMAAPAHEAHNLRDALTMFAWVTTTGGGTRATIVKMGAPATSGYYLRVDPSGVPRIAVSVVDSPAFVGHNGITAVNDGKPHLLVGSYDREALRIYVDGRLDSTLAETRRIRDTGGQPLRFGAWEGSGGLADFFSGDVFSAGLYDRAISPLEIRRLFESHPLSRVARVGGSFS